MIRRAVLVLFLSLAVGTACTNDLDPCPEGASLAGDRCAIQGAAMPQDAGKPSGSMDAAPEGGGEDDAALDGGDASEMETDAATPEQDADLDAAELDADGNELDAQADATPAPLPDAASDSATDAASDAAVDAGDGAANLCEAEDVARWYDFHLSSVLVTSIGSCWRTEPGCSSDSCPMLACLQQNLGIRGCETCIAEEAACVAAACAERCGASTDNESCRACACSNGCVLAFEACTGATLDVCADCDETTCANMSRLPPELIMAVLQLLL